MKAGLERDKAALLVVLGAMRDGTKEVLALRSGYRESVESWSEVLRDLKARGIEAPRLLMADGNAAIWGAVRQVWPEAGEQRCAAEPEEKKDPGHDHVPGEEEGHEATREDQTAPTASFLQNSRDRLQPVGDHRHHREHGANQEHHWLGGLESLAEGLHQAV